jgi:hypothetical protein
LPFGQGKKWFASGWKKTVLGGLRAFLDPDAGERQPDHLRFAGSPYNYYPGFARAMAARIAWATFKYANDWYNLGGDRFTTGQHQLRL